MSFRPIKINFPDGGQKIFNPIEVQPQLNSCGGGRRIICRVEDLPAKNKDAGAIEGTLQCEGLSFENETVFWCKYACFLSSKMSGPKDILSLALIIYFFPNHDYIWFFSDWNVRALASENKLFSSWLYLILNERNITVYLSSWVNVFIAHLLYIEWI